MPSNRVLTQASSFALPSSWKSKPAFPHAFSHMDEIEHDQRVIALFPEQFLQILDLSLVAVHQRHPPLSSLRVTPPRLAKRLTDHFLGRLFQTGPNAFALRLRPVWFFPLVIRRQTPQHILWRPFGRDRVNASD